MDFEASVFEAKSAMELIEKAGRICWKSEPKTDDPKPFIRNLIKRGHTSVMEHAGMVMSDQVPIQGNWKYIYPTNLGNLLNARTMLYFAEHSCGHVIHEDKDVDQFIDILENSPWLPDLHPVFDIRCDRGVSHEGVRNRTISEDMDPMTAVSDFIADMAVTQESQRYVKFSDAELPVTLSDHSRFLMEECEDKYGIDKAFRASMESYTSMVNDGIKPQQARMVLPNATSTRMILSGWMWEWLWFIDLRNDPAAHPDMRCISSQINDQLRLRYDLDWWRAHRDRFDMFKQMIPSVPVSITK